MVFKFRRCIDKDEPSVELMDIKTKVEGESTEELITAKNEDAKMSR